jgi:hypothetical protein
VQGIGLDVDADAELNGSAAWDVGLRGEDDFFVGRNVFQDATRVAGREGESGPQWRGCLPADWR